MDRRQHLAPTAAARADHNFRAEQLRGESLPFTGNLSFALALTGGTPGSLAILGTGQPGLPTPLGSGCLLALAAPMTTVVQPTNAGGAARWPLPIPDVPVLRGVLLSAQAAVIGPAGQAFTTELVTIQVGE